MNRIRYAFAMAALGLVCAAFGQLPEHVPGQLHVKFVPGQGSGLNAAIQAQELHYTSAIGLSLVKLPAGMSVEQGLAYYRAKPGVSYADPVWIRRADWVPNDPKWSQQWGPQKIKCVQGWDVMRGNTNTTIAIIDTGIDKTHEDLAGKVFGGHDFVNDDDDAQDDHGHGTHCAGTAAGITNNGIGIAGVAPNCPLMPVKVLSAGGSGTSEWVINGMIFAADNGAKILSMSLGSSGSSSGEQDAVRYAIGKGAIVIAAAGNHGTTALHYPAAYPECVAVASTTQSDTRSSFSAYGDWVDVAAPGSGILSSVPGNGYEAWDGTSMATPHVAGLAGLIKSIWPNATVAQLRAQIENNCDFVGNFVVRGRINVFRSIPTLVTTDPYSMVPAAVAKFEGANAYNTVNQARVSDNTYYAVSSSLVARLGHVASAKITFVSTKDPSTLQLLKVKVEASAASYVTGTMFLWNNSTNSWQYIAAGPLTGTDSVREFTVPTPYSKYFNASRQCFVLYRGVMPVSPTRQAVQFPLRIDLAQMNGRVPR